MASFMVTGKTVRNDVNASVRGPSVHLVAVAAQIVQFDSALAGIHLEDHVSEADDRLRKRALVKIRFLTPQDGSIAL